jgi:hypothetical protein
MRWIKKFEASTNSSFRDELKEFCEMNLAYLMDDDYDCYYIRDKSIWSKGYIINFYKWTTHPNGRDVVKLPFTWDMIKDHFIPFLQRLSNSYKVVQLELVMQFGSTSYTVTLESLINDELPIGLLKKNEHYRSMVGIKIMLENETY